MELDKARTIAADLLAAINPYCEKAIIAGSVRRGKPEVKDIEIVAMPRVIDVSLPGLGAPKLKSRLGMALNVMIERGVLFKLMGADKFQQYAINLLHWEIFSSIVFKLDLFIVQDARAWGPQVVIRTGPAEFSHWCVTKRIDGGAMPNGFHLNGGLVIDYASGAIHPMPEEQDFLDFLGLGWIEPCDRQPDWQRFA